MGSLPVKRLLIKMSVPVILSMMVSSLYNIIDSIFIARLSQNALTAMSLATPISSLIACVSVGFSVGMNAVLSKKLGEKDREGANHAAGNGLLIESIWAVIFMVFGLFFVKYFYQVQTDILEIQQLGTQYTSIVCIFAFGVCNQAILERMLIATVKAQCTAACVALVFNLKVNKDLHFSFNMLKPRSKIMKQIWEVGFSTALQQSISPMMIFGMNQILLGFTAAAPAVYVIYVRLQSIVLIPIRGIKNTVVSIISYNFGAKYKERILETIKLCIIATIFITLIGLLLFQLIPIPLLSLFNAQGEVLEIGKVALRIISFVFPFSGMTLLLGAFFQALGHSKTTLVTSIVQLIVMLVSAFVLSKIGSVYTAWFAFVITEVLVSIIAMAFMKHITEKTINKI